MVYNNSSFKVRQDAAPIFINSKKEIALRVEIETDNIFAVEKRKGI